MLLTRTLAIVHYLQATAANMEAVAALLRANDEDSECTACSSLAHLSVSDRLVLLLAAQSPVVALDPSVGTRGFSCMLEELLLYFTLRSFSKVPMSIADAVKSDTKCFAWRTYWSISKAPGVELKGHFMKLQTYVQVLLDYTMSCLRIQLTPALVCALVHASAGYCFSQSGVPMH